MSLIIASNINLKDSPSSSEIHKPYSWSNRTSNTFKIDADSEIAVQSVKINKSGQLSVGQSNSNYSLYLGEDIDDQLSLEDSVYHPVADSVIRGDEVIELTTDELARRVEDSMKKNVLNPHFYDADGTPSVSVVPKENITTGAYEGLKWTFNQDAEPEDEIPADSKAQSVFPTSRFTYASGLFTKTAGGGVAPRGACAVFPDRPCLLSGTDAFPSVNYDITGGTGVDKGTWAIGLTRYNLDNPLVDPSSGDVKCFAPPYFNPNFNGGHSFLGYAFFDFVAVRTSDNLLKIYQSCVQSQKKSGDQLTMKEVVYYHGGNQTFKSGPYDLSANPTAYTHIRFRVENQGVICEIGKHATSSFVTLVNTTLGNKNNMFFPRSCLQNFLYPQIFVSKDATAIGFEERYSYANIEATGFKPEDPDVDWVARLTDTGKYIKWGKAVEDRPHNDGNPSLGTTAYGYEGIYPYGGGGTSGGHLENVQANLILAPSSVYGLEYTANANTQFLFGFKSRSLAIGDFNSGNGGSTIESISVPILTSPKSLFVRVNNLTQQSINAQLGNAYSKIIAHLPRFDSAGNEVGGLYFEPNELVYVSLNNPNDLFLNSIDIDLVYDNETYAECLSGKSIVVLHIRKKK